MKTIISAVDFTPMGVNASYYAADLAATVGAKLLLMNVVALPVLAAEVPTPAYGIDEVIGDTEEQLEQLKKELLRHAHGQLEIDCRYAVGSVPYQLQNACQQQDVLALVMGKDSPDAVERLLTGSNTLNTIKAVHIPILVVPNHTSFKWPNRILLAADMHDVENYQPIQYLRNWLKLFRPKLDILHVYRHQEVDPRAVSGSVALQNDLAEFNPEFHFEHANNVEQAVIRSVKDLQPDMLIVLPKTHGLLTGLLYKSKSKPILLHAQLPVLAIHE